MADVVGDRLGRPLSPWAAASLWPAVVDPMLRAWTVNPGQSPRTRNRKDRRHRVAGRRIHAGAQVDGDPASSSTSDLFVARLSVINPSDGEPAPHAPGFRTGEGA